MASSENEHKSLLRAATDAVTPPQFQEEAYQITAGALKTLGTFTPGRFGLLASAAIYAADEMKTDDPNWVDGALGAGKGVLNRSLTTRALDAGMNPALTAIAISAGSRGIDSALTRTTWDQGVGAGFGKIGERLFDPKATMADAIVGAVSYPLMRAAGGYFGANSFRQTAAVGFVSGYTGGLYEELNRESQSGQIDPERLAIYPFARAVSSAVASTPGAQRRFVNEYPWKQAGVTRDMDYQMVQISAEDVAKIKRAGSGEVSVKPLLIDGTLGAAETVSINRQTVPQDWISAAMNSLRPRAALPEEQLRYMSRPAGAESGPWNMVIQPSLKTVSEAVKSAPGNYYAKNEVLPRVGNLVEPTVKYLGSGAQSGAFLLGNGTVLKLSREHGNVARETEDYGQSPLDARMVAKPVDMGTIDRYTQLSAYAQEFVKSPVTTKQAEALREEAPKHGWYFSDYNFHLNGDQMSWATDQAGINANGKTVFIDYGARRPAYGWTKPEPQVDPAPEKPAD